MAQPLQPLLVGYYGEHNLGDDALLEVLLSQLPPGCRPTVTAHDQSLVAERFGLASVDRRQLAAVLAALGRSDALVLGGGSLLQDATSFASLLYYAALILTARIQAKPVLLWAQGLGPLRRRRSRLLVRGLLALVTACSWRDQASAQLAASLGWPPAPRGPGGDQRGPSQPPAQQAAQRQAQRTDRQTCQQMVAADPVWSLAAPSWRGPGGPIVLCFRPTSHLRGAAWKPWLGALEQLAPDRELIWLPFHAHQDRGLLKSLGQQGLLSPALLSRSRELLVERPAEAMEVCAGAGLVLAMRLHGLILAANCGAPTAALSYDPKVNAAAGDLGCLCTPLDAPAPDDLAAQWRRCLDQPPSLPRLERLRASAATHRALLARLA